MAEIILLSEFSLHHPHFKSNRFITADNDKTVTKTKFMVAEMVD